LIHIKQDFPRAVGSACRLLLLSCLDYFSILKIEAMYFSEVRDVTPKKNASAVKTSNITANFLTGF
jgi:hypothetical protein